MIQKREWGRGVWYFYLSRLTPLMTALPPNLTRLLHNNATYVGYVFGVFSLLFFMREGIDGGDKW